ncbi:MAG TPA: methyltransferase domain-containing protein [Tepidisphaeraceae bacterium]|jgi:hypothetical protein|nr:methyltransferase domain-containing protein [Tepidisphaeraceae bacterium]
MPRLVARTPSPIDAVANPASIRGSYERYGADGFYEEIGKNYRNPHEPIVVRSLIDAMARWRPDVSHVLDLAAGSGEVTLALKNLGAERIDGIDPFTAEAYAARTGVLAEKFTFADIATGVLSGRRYSLIVCSFALHLCEKSRLPAVSQQLSLGGDSLLIITPHKRPLLQKQWGWKIMGENVIDRVRSRYYLRNGE